MKRNALRCSLLIAGLALLGCAVTVANAQPASPAFPVKPVRIIVGNSPGGANDLLARLIGQKLTEAWGQQVTIENRDGASGVIAMELAARAPADGYTLLLSGSQMATNTVLGKVPFDIRKAYEQVVELVMQGYLMINSYGFFAPAGTPAAIVNAINRQCNQVISAPDFKARLEADGVEAAPPNTPADYRSSIDRQIADLEKFFRTPGISKESFNPVAR
jgi:tripartite-type tricarboxylate transporter receptor subunit TctC